MATPQDAHRDWVDAYLDGLLTQRKYSLHTISAYRRDLTDLAALTEPTRFDAVTHFDIRQFAAKLHARGITPRSISRKLSAWRSFFAWLSEQTPLAANPVEGVKPPKRPRPLPKALSQDDAIRLVSGTRPTPTNDEPDAQGSQAPQEDIMHLCNRAMFELLYSSGLRVSELTALDWRYVQQDGHVSVGWLDAASAEVIVTGKGGKRRSVPVGKPALAALALWQEARAALGHRSVGNDRYALFLSTLGTRMSPRTIQLRLKAHARALGIPVDVHPHMLRHSFASHVLQSSGDLRAVQEMLGHSAIASTQVYTALDFQRLAQVYDATHPRAKITSENKE